MKRNGRKTMTLRLDEAIANAMQHLARMDGRNMNAEVEQACYDFCVAHEADLPPELRLPRRARHGPAPDTATE